MAARRRSTARSGWCFLGRGGMQHGLTTSTATEPSDDWDNRPFAPSQMGATAAATAGAAGVAVKGAARAVW